MGWRRSVIVGERSELWRDNAKGVSGATGGSESQNKNSEVWSS